MWQMIDCVLEIACNVGEWKPEKEERVLSLVDYNNNSKVGDRWLIVWEIVSEKEKCVL